jgi:hypothetical protein
LKNTFPTFVLPRVVALFAEMPSCVKILMIFGVSCVEQKTDRGDVKNSLRGKPVWKNSVVGFLMAKNRAQ